MHKHFLFLLLAWLLLHSLPIRIAVAAAPVKQDADEVGLPEADPSLAIADTNFNFDNQASRFMASIGYSF